MDSTRIFLRITRFPFYLMENNVLRRTLAFLVSGGLLLQLSPAYAAISFRDVYDAHENAEAIDALKKSGVLQGYADGSFKPGAAINRAEFLKIILEARDDVAFSGGSCFPDVKNQWFAPYVCTAKEEGIVSGYPDGLFKPEKDISFVEAAKILSLAYGQSVDTGYQDWFEPYARALEQSKAIPTSVHALDEKLTRGEMAEMMWRLSSGKTDRPSKGYLNVKYPEMQVNMASEEVQTAKSCADLKAFTEEAQKIGGGFGMRNQMLQESGDEAVAAPTAGSAHKSMNAESDGYSQTNVQVAGVDEGDIVKTDGTYLYVVSERMIRIVKVVPATNMTLVSTINLEDEAFNPSDLYIDGNRLVVIGNRWGRGGDVGIMNMKIAPNIWPGPSYGSNKVEVRIYNVANKSAPSIARKVSFDGASVTTRKIGTDLYVVLNQQPSYGGPIPLAKAENETTLMPKFEDSADGGTEKPVARCADVAILPHVPRPQYLMIGVIPVQDTTKKVQTSVVLGSAENVYASLDNMYVAQTEWNYIWDSATPESNQKTSVYRFAYADDGVEFAAQGEVRGRILNQFSMDEHENNFRIATTLDAMGETQKSLNNLYVLNMNMEQVGGLEDIAPGEKIYSTRFMGDRTYMVTFKQVDPLFVIDTSNPRSPHILGKLKIPGYSDYLHPYDETHLLGFGKEVDETIDADKVHTDDAVYYTAILGMKVALFDVSDVEHPKELHKEVIGDRGTESPLLYDHKALLFEKNNGLLSFPVSVMELPEGTSPKDENAYPTQSFQGAYVFDVSLENGFDLKGRISHYDDQDALKSGNYLYGKDIIRVVRIGESLFTVSPAGVKSTAMKDLKDQDTVQFTKETVEDVIYE